MEFKMVRGRRDGQELTFYEAESAVRTEIHSERGRSLGSGQESQTRPQAGRKTDEVAQKEYGQGCRKLTHSGERPLICPNRYPATKKFKCF